MNDSPFTAFLKYSNRLHQCVAFRSPVTGELLIHMLAPETMGTVIIVSPAGNGFSTVAAGVLFFVRNDEILHESIIAIDYGY